MKKILKIILKLYLKIVTKLVLLLHNPEIIIIAGSTNKVFTKNAIKKSLENLNIDIKFAPRNFNTDIGIPLAILSLKSGYNEYKKWIPTILKAFLVIFKKKFPKYIVLTYATSDVGDMKYLLSIAKPKITIITEITQKYIEGFDHNIDKLLNEYKELCLHTDKNGVIILNSDNKEIRNIAKNSNIKTIFFGKHKESDFQIIDIKRISSGEQFKIKHNNEIKQYKINKFGEHHIYAFVIGKIVKILIKNNK